MNTAMQSNADTSAAARLARDMDVVLMLCAIWRLLEVVEMVVGTA